jgi:pimeloyl-ACP methyl ester carboxylesterase
VSVCLLLAALALTVSAAHDVTIANRGAVLAGTLVLPETGKPPFPAVVLVHGSGRVTAQEQLNFMAHRFGALGIAVLAYDKRGVGRSTGDYATVGVGNSIEMFDLLASDALAALEALKGRREIDAARIGLAGVSQGGWIAPLAASRSSDVKFVITVSGPAVSVGEEIAYSRLAGEDPGSQQGLSDEEIARRMREFRGPYGYDPAPVLSSLATPSLWILGEHDRSIPLRHTVDVLTKLSRARPRTFSIHVIPGVNHRLMDPTTGRRPDIWGTVGAWLRAQGIVRNGSSARMPRASVASEPRDRSVP